MRIQENNCSKTIPEWPVDYSNETTLSTGLVCCLVYYRCENERNTLFVLTKPQTIHAQRYTVKWHDSLNGKKVSLTCILRLIIHLASISTS